MSQPTPLPTKIKPIGVPIAAPLIVAFLFWASTAVHLQNSWQYSVLQAVGQTPKIRSEPGIFVYYPWPVGTVTMFDHRVKISPSSGDVTMTLLDKSALDVSWMLSWQVKNVALTQKHWSTLSETQILQWLNSEINDFLQNQLTLLSFEQLLVNRETIQKNLLSHIQITARTRGIDISAISVAVDLNKAQKEAIVQTMSKDIKNQVDAIDNETNQKVSELNARTDAKAAALLVDAERQANQLTGQAQQQVIQIAQPLYSKNQGLAKLLIDLDATKAGLSQSQGVLQYDGKAFALKKNSSGKTQ